MNYKPKQQIVLRRTITSALSLGTLLILVIVSACNHEPTSPAPVYDPGTYKTSTYPLFNGNQWVYVDSSYDSQQRSRAFVRLSLTSIVKYTEDNTQASWEINQSYIAGDFTYAVENDTVYVNDWKRNGALLNPRIAFLPSGAVQDTVLINGPYPDTKTKVYPLGHTYTTPAGTFDSVFVYENNANRIESEKTLTYFRPSVGILCVETLWSHYVHRSVLAAYVIAK